MITIEFATSRAVRLNQLWVHTGPNRQADGEFRQETAIFVNQITLDDIRRWGIDEIDEVTRRELMTSP